MLYASGADCGKKAPPAHSANDLQAITQLDSTTVSASLQQSTERLLAPMQSQYSQIDLDRHAAPANPLHLQDSCGLDYSPTSGVLASAGDGWGVPGSVAYEL